MAQANGSLVSAAADEDLPQTTRPSCPSTVYVASISRTRGGSTAVCVPLWWGLLPKTIAFPFPDQVPLRSGTASCAKAGVAGAATLRSASTRAKHLIASSHRCELIEVSWAGKGDQFGRWTIGLAFTALMKSV